jgi:hypothetical protein
MSDVSFGLALQSLRCVAAGVDGKLPCTTAQESNAAPVADANKNVQIQDESLGAGEESAEHGLHRSWCEWAKPHPLAGQFELE